MAKAFKWGSSERDDCRRALADKRAFDFDRRDTRGCSALHVAAQWGDLELVKALLDAGADPDAVDAYKKVPADFASHSSHDECLSILLRAMKSLAPAAARRYLNQAAKRILPMTLRALASRAIDFGSLKPPPRLAVAAIVGDLPTARALVSRVDPACFSDSWTHPVSVAARNGNLEVLELLLDAWDHVIEHDDAMPVCAALRSGHAAIVEALHARGWPVRCSLVSHIASTGELQWLDWRGDGGSMVSLGDAIRIGSEARLSVDQVDFLLERVDPSVVDEPDAVAVGLAEAIASNAVHLIAALARRGLIPEPAAGHQTWFDRAWLVRTWWTEPPREPSVMSILREHRPADAAFVDDPVACEQLIRRDHMERYSIVMPELLGLMQHASDWEHLGHGEFRHRGRTLRMQTPAHPVHERICRAVYGLEPTVSAQAHHGLAEDVWLGRIRQEAIEDFFPGRGARLRRRVLYALQRTDTGAMVTFDNSRVPVVVGWCTQRSDFVELGGIEEFLGYCVRQTLRGRYWYQALAERQDLDGSGLIWADLG